MSSKKADQILKRLQGEGLIAKDKPATEKKKFKGYNKNKPKGKFGKPVKTEQKPTTNNGGGNANNGSHGGNNKKKKHFHKKRPSNQQQPVGQNQQQPATAQVSEPKTINGFIKEPVVVGKVARIVHVADGVVLINYTERPLRRKRICKVAHIEGTNELPEPAPFMASIGQQVRHMFSTMPQLVDTHVDRPDEDEPQEETEYGDMVHMHVQYGQSNFAPKYKAA